MTTARNARISGIAVSWGFRKKQELLNSSALVVIDHPLELLEYFNSVTK
jgi:phosphoglycolate phosphatase